MNEFSLNKLADPTEFHQPINISNTEPECLQAYLKKMMLIRFVEQRLAEGRRDGQIGGPVHLGAGQEAVAVGVSSSLHSSDRIFGAHRSHSHLLALGSSVHGLFAEALGKNTGHSKGMGGSMHLWDQHHGFYGSVPIVAGTVSLAVGAGLAAKMQKTNDVSVAYLGDGAIEEGVVHESLNLARMLDTPTLFVVENNLFSSHMHISLRQPKDSTARFAVASAAKDMIESARNGNGPGFIEAVTFRWYGHVDWRDDIDVGVHRSQDELKNWRSRDPISRLTVSMKNLNLLSDGQEEKLKDELKAIVDSAWKQAIQDPYPENSDLLSRVYAEKRDRS